MRKSHLIISACLAILIGAVLALRERPMQHVEVKSVLNELRAPTRTEQSVYRMYALWWTVTEQQLEDKQEPFASSSRQREMDKIYVRIEREYKLAREQIDAIVNRGDRECWYADMFPRRQDML